MVLAFTMVDFWGLWASALTIAVGIVGVGIMVWYELRKQNSKFQDTKNELNSMNQFLKTITVAQIHEKIAVLYDYPTKMPWKTQDEEYQTSKMISDIRYLQEVRSILTSQQLEELHVVQTKLDSAMQANSYDATRIDAGFQVVFSNS